MLFVYGTLVVLGGIRVKELVKTRIACQSVTEFLLSGLSSEVPSNYRITYAEQSIDAARHNKLIC